MEGQQYNWEELLAKLERNEQLSEDQLASLSPEEQAFLASLKSKEELKHMISFLATIDNDNDWQTLNAKIAQVNIKTIPVWTKILRYAAILFIPLLIAVLYYKNNTAEKSTQVYVQHKKAFLQLSDGSSIALGNLSNTDIFDEHGVKINNKDTSVLTYNNLQNVKDLRYNKLVVPRGGEYSLVLDDGTKIFVNAESVLRFPISFNASQTRDVYLETGEAYFEVAKNPEKPFVVHTNTSAVKVLGTSFNVNFYNPNVVTTLVEGYVKTGFANKEMIDLYPNQQSVIDAVTGKIDKKAIDVEAAVAWKDGFIVFDDEDLDHVMNLLGRWYDYTIVFEDESLKNQHFNAKIKKYSSITDVLSIIEQTGKSKFKILDGKIHVLKK